MKWYDWLIVVLPLLLVFGMGFYSRRYLKDVSAFLTAGRVCGRYVISVGSIVNALSVIGLLSYAEIHCKTGFALSFWNAVTIPITVLIGLYGYCTYRYRETKAQSIGQFLEIRYSRKFRIFAAALRSFSEILANMIMPALAARFFIYFLDVPDTFTLFGFGFSSFHCIMIVVLIAAISIICLGGSLAIIVTDTVQGFICYPLMVLFIVFILYKFSWSEEILPVLSSRVAGESFLNPYEIYNLRDFNYFFLIVGIFSIFVHRLSWAGSGGGGSAARTPHEQKMAGLLGSWRAAIGSVFYVLLAISLLAFMNHFRYAGEAHKVRVELSSRIARDVIPDPQILKRVENDIQKMPVWTFHPQTDRPLAAKKNVDTHYLEYIRKGLAMKDAAQGNLMFQKFRTLYQQQMLSSALRNLLPPGLLGLFCLLMILAMISTDDTRIFSSAVTISQDVVLPFIKKEITPRQHMWLIRCVAIGIGIFFFIGSSYMAQLDYISMYVQLVTTMWLGGCGPLLIFGLYSRFGTAKGAWASLLTGVALAILGVLIQRNWADYVYPWLDARQLTGAVGNALATLSGPFEPIIKWRMNPVKCPVNSYEWFFLTEIITFALYVGVSCLTCRKPYNLDRMLHRGKYAETETAKAGVWSKTNLYKRFIGITPEYTFWDRVLAWCYFVYQFGYRFFCAFLVVVIWNLIDPWPVSRWGWYFLIVFLIVPGIMALITAVWFGICGTLDLKQMFRDLEKRVANPLDDGRVEGNVSLADKARVEKIDGKGSFKTNGPYSDY